MGWSAQRQAHLHRVLCLSRFLIPACNAATGRHVLGRVLHRLPAPLPVLWLVETLSALRTTEPASRRPVWVGHTAGRGRPDRHAGRTVKSVYMYELEPRWRRQLGLARVAAAPALAPGDGLDSTQWTRTSLEGRRWATAFVGASGQERGLLAALPGQALTANAAHDRRR